MTFSDFHEHTSALFKKLTNLLKLDDIIYIHIAMFVHDYTNHKLPPVFNNFFRLRSSIHHHNTRLASTSSYFVSSQNTNYGKFTTSCKGTKVWDTIPEDIKALNRTSFKSSIQSLCLANY